MKRIFLLLVSASVASVSCSGGSSSAGKPGTKGELIPKEKTKSFVAERPYGMVAIPGGSFVAGLTDYSFNNNPESASPKTVTVNSFFMDETETTNGEYRVFINYVRDSIARTLLAEAAGEGGEGGKKGASIGDYAYLAKKEENSDLVDKVLNHLEKVKSNRPEVAHLIDNGLELIFEKANA